MIIDDKIKITMLPARAGDCLLIEFIKEDYRILIDGGYADTYDKYLRQKLLSTIFTTEIYNLKLPRI